MVAKRTVREIKTSADLMCTALQQAQTDVDPATLKLRLLAAVLQAESYKKLPQWRQACLQGFCEGLALGRGITAGLAVETPIPSEKPPEATNEAFESEAPSSSEIRSIRPPQPDIESLQRLLAIVQGLPEKQRAALLGTATPEPVQAPASKTATASARANNMSPKHDGKKPAIRARP